MLNALIPPRFWKIISLGETTVCLNHHETTDIARVEAAKCEGAVMERCASGRNLGVGPLHCARKGCASVLTSGKCYAHTLFEQSGGAGALSSYCLPMCLHLWTRAGPGPGQMNILKNLHCGPLPRHRVRASDTRHPFLALAFTPVSPLPQVAST